MAMGILGQHADNTVIGPITVYTVPAGKVAVFNIFVTNSNGGTTGIVKIDNANIGYVPPFNVGADNIEFKGIIGNAGTTVKFNNCIGIVTGYEEDA